MRDWKVSLQPTHPPPSPSREPCVVSSQFPRALCGETQPKNRIKIHCGKMKNGPKLCFRLTLPCVFNQFFKLCKDFLKSQLVYYIQLKISQLHNWTFFITFIRKIVEKVGLLSFYFFPGRKIQFFQFSFFNTKIIFTHILSTTFSPVKKTYFHGFEIE